MTLKELEQLATRQDLLQLKKDLISQVKQIVKDAQVKEFYTIKEFSNLTSLGYSTALKYCQSGKIKAKQESTGGSWIIHREEVEKWIEESKKSRLIQ